MLQSMTVTNYRGESIVINLTDAEPEHGLIIKEIAGLGPPKAFINMSDYATDDGSKWNSSRADRRTITMTFYLSMIPDIEAARANTYKYFPLKKEVTLEFLTDHRRCKTTGRVESNEPSIFTDRAENTITIVCEEPWLYKVGDDEPNITSFGTADPAFEFPFSNEDLEIKKIVFGNYMVHQARVISYEGDASVGVTITILCLAAGVGDITLYNQTSEETMTIHTGNIASVTGSAFTVGDQIIISTVDRTRSAKLLRNGIFTNILNVVERSSDWFELEKGDNTFFFYTSSGRDEYINITFENRTVYEGI